MRSNCVQNSPVRRAGTRAERNEKMPGIFEIELRFAPGENDSPQFEALLDATADELEKIGVEADYTAALAGLTAIWTIDVPDASEKSLIDALNSLRTALHAAGVVTAAMGTTHEVASTRHLALA
jgi:hypothetical protein